MRLSLLLKLLTQKIRRKRDVQHSSFRRLPENAARDAAIREAMRQARERGERDWPSKFNDRDFNGGW